MAVRNVGNPAAKQAGARTGSLGQLTQRLGKLGLLGGGRTAQRVAGNILSNLQAAGFGAGARGTLLANLTLAVAAFQRAHGLPPTGQLDAQTAQAMKALGMLAPGGVRDGFEGGAAKDAQKTLGQASQKTAPDAARAKEPGLSAGALSATGDPRALLEQMLAKKEGGEAGAQAGPAGQGAQGTGAEGRQALGLQAGLTGAHTGDRVDGLATKDPSGAGAREGDLEAEKGRGKKGDRGGQLGGGDEEGGEAQADGDEDAALAEDQGHREGTGNAPSGEPPDGREERGHATLGDDEAEADFHRLPSLADQLDAALGAITRHEHASRARTYTLDVTFYRPGVYGAGQKAEELLHLVVEDAGPFDPVWDRALEAIGRLLARVEPAAVAPTRLGLERALRRARVRE